MKIKNTTLMLVSAFVLVFCLVFTSASLSFDQIALTNTIEAGQGTSVSLPFSLATTQNNTALNWISTTSLNEGSWSPFSALSNSILLSESPKSYEVKINNIPLNFIGYITSNVNVTDSNTNDSAEIPVSVEVTPPSNFFCSTITNSDDLELSVDVKTSGEDKDKWMPLDILSVDVSLKNNRDSDGQDLFDLTNVVFEITLKKLSSPDNYLENMTWISKDEYKLEVGDVDEGKKASHTFEFKMNPPEMEEGNYILMVKAYPLGEEAINCIDFSEDLLNDFSDSAYWANIIVNVEHDKSKVVVVDEDTLTKDATASCEQQVSFSADVWNIGNKNFTDQILVNLYNDELNLNQNVTIEGDLNMSEKTQAEFNFNVPSGAEEKQYDLSMQTYYDYDSNTEEYDRVSSNIFNFPLTISGNCAVPKASVNADLEDGGQSGKPLIVRATITNIGAQDSTYTFTADGYSDWASSATINNSLTLSPGQSQDIFVTLDVKKDTEIGNYTFNINVYSGGDQIVAQPVQVAVTGKPGLFANGGVALPILIAIITILLVVVIIVLIARAARKK